MVVPLAARKTYLARLKLRRDYYKLADCNFWVFEEADLPGAFIEFTGGGGRARPHGRARQRARRVFDATRVYREVEIE
jgi:hypothetical protein